MMFDTWDIVGLSGAVCVLVGAFMLDPGAALVMLGLGLIGLYVAREVRHVQPPRPGQ